MYFDVLEHFEKDGQPHAKRVYNGPDETVARTLWESVSAGLFAVRNQEGSWKAVEHRPQRTTPEHAIGTTTVLTPTPLTPPASPQTELQSVDDFFALI